MVKKFGTLIILAVAGTAFAASNFYWDFPPTTLEPTDRILVYKGYSTPGRDRNVLGLAFIDPLKNYTTVDRVTAVQLANYTTADRVTSARLSTYSSHTQAQITAHRNTTINPHGSAMSTTVSLSSPRLYATGSSPSTPGLTVSGSRANILFDTVGATGGVAFSLIQAKVTNTDPVSAIWGNVGLYGSAYSGSDPAAIYMYFDARNTANAYTGSTLKITPTGKVGIGFATTTVPTSTLHVDGDIKSTTLVTTPSITTAAGDAKLLIGSTSAYDNGNHRLGIGTISPRGTMDAYSSAKGKGRVYAGSATNYGVFDQALGLRYAGNTTTWDDSMTPAALFRTGGTALTFADCGNGIFLNRFDVGDIFYVQVQMPHLMKQNTTLYPHLHLMVNSAIGATGYNVAVSTSHSWSNINSAFPVVTTVNPQTSVSVANSAQYKHFVYPFAPIVPTAGQGGISSMLMYKVERITASIQPLTPATSLFVLGLDIHYESDGSASDEEFVKQ